MQNTEWRTGHGKIKVLFLRLTSGDPDASAQKDPPGRRVKRGKVKKPRSLDEDQTPAECGVDVKIIACIGDPAVIQKILAHLDDRAGPADLSTLNFRAV